MSSGSRVSIPNSVRKTIQNIKEIAGNHSDDEIYAMLKECSMDPNETAQKLLLQADTFHEVRRKRDKRKESLNNRESADARWRPGTQGRGGRGGRGNYSPRYISQDAGGGKNASFGKENGVKQGSEKGGTPSILPASQETESKATTSVSSSVPAMANGAINVSNGSSIHGRASQLTTGSGTNPLEENSPVDVSNLRSARVPPVNAKSAVPSGVTIARKQATPSSEHLASPASVLGVYSSASDPVLVPNIDSRVPGAVGTIKREVRVQRAAVESNATIPAESISTTSRDFADGPQVNKLVSHDVTNSNLSSSINEQAISEIENSFMHGKMPSKSLGVENNQHSESSEPSSSSAHGGSSVSRPSSNYGSLSQQLMGSQKAVGPSKEWKPKLMNSNAAPASREVVSSKVVPITDDADAQSLPVLNAAASKEATSKLQKKLEELHFYDSHVIIPNHLQVPESERTGLSFGSFDANFGVRTSYSNGLDTEKISTTVSESSQEIEEIAEEPSSSNQNVSQDAQEGDYSDNSPSPMEVPENISSGVANVSSCAVSDYDQSKSETALPPGGPQYSVVHTVPTYSTFGLMPPMLGTQFAPFDSSEPQARDASRLPGFVVQQPFDPSASYYTQLYRPGADGDGRFSPLLTPAAATKYNGNVAVLSSQSGQSPQENGNSLVLSTASPTPLVTQAAGVMQNSIAVTQQQPVPVFRQPPGLHMSHFPPNYIPYSSYYSPFFVPPPTIHQFLSNTTFPQQPPSGNVYPPPAATAATGIKYSLPQFKAGTNTGSTTHIGMQPGYAQFSSPPAGYSPSPAVTTGNTTGNEDLAAAQFKENNVYITGQQSEGGSGVWVPAPGRDISGMQASSFYNLSPQGHHVTFAPTQAGHAAFAGIYHPTQTMAAATVHPLLQQSQTMAGAVEMVGPPAGVYQQPQRPQINWTNTY
ncbi:Protein of unknown function DUF1296 [Macleaya cordata]|uniref:GBF-interacting protein 1 N-terminal domain-containing protein n=1 Tax=Macleaya cordata TaxID=56857 RepID=A0A200RAP1_MACCD|nr:Protein of unknown function DUF1296 [Macleaya cordata]